MAYSTEGAMRGGTYNLHPVSYPCILHPIHASYPTFASRHMYASDPISYSKKQKEEKKKMKKKWKAGIMSDRIFSKIRFADKRVALDQYKVSMMLWESPLLISKKRKMSRNRSSRSSRSLCWPTPSPWTGSLPRMKTTQSKFISHPL